MASNYKWTIRFSILTPILIIICTFLIGGGHGWYTPSLLLFPWATLNIVWQDHLSSTFLIAGAFQFIVYGMLIDKTRNTKSRNLVVAGIFLSHTVMIILIFMMKNPGWR